MLKFMGKKIFYNYTLKFFCSSIPMGETINGKNMLQKKPINYKGHSVEKPPKVSYTKMSVI